MNILQTLKQLRDDIKSWVTINLNALNDKIDEKTIPIDSELNLNSTNPVQNKAIATEVANINKRVGNTSVAKQISDAIANQPHFSGDYNDLINAPDITEDGTGNMVITDESGNIIFKADAEGIHTTALSLNGESAATESYVDNAIANIEFPETDLTGYATEDYVTNAINSIDIPEVDFTGYATETYVDNKVADLVNSAPEALDTLGELATALENHEDVYDALLETVGSKATQTDLENLKNEISESIVSETDEFHIVDDNGNIVASIDENGVATTTVTAQSIIVNGDNVEEHIDNTGIHVTAAEKDSWNKKSNFSGSYNDLTDKPEAVDLSGYAEKVHGHNISDIIDLENELTSLREELIYGNTLYIQVNYTDFDTQTMTFTECVCDVSAIDILTYVVNASLNPVILFPIIGEEDVIAVPLTHWNNDLLEFSNIITINDQLMRIVITFTGNDTITAKLEPIKNDEVDLTGYATEEYVTTAISNIDIPETDLTNYYTKTETDTAIESAKEELSESIVSESEEWHIVDNNGNIVATVDANGISTTTVAAQNITINGLDLEELIQARVQAYIDQAILGGEW